MKKKIKLLSFIITFLGILPIFNLSLSAQSFEPNNTQTNMIILDKDGNSHQVNIDNDKIYYEDNNQFGPVKYGFHKNCLDEIGCPYEINGIINGHDFVVYKQWQVLNTAYYEGFIYE